MLVTGATMANFTGLIAARSWWAERCGFDADEAGLAGAPAPVILTQRLRPPERDAGDQHGSASAAPTSAGSLATASGGSTSRRSPPRSPSRVRRS